jgi:hypothetical protein
VFDGIRIREASHSALEISDASCAEPRSLRQSSLGQTSALSKLSKKLSKHAPILLVWHAIEAEHSTVFRPTSAACRGNPK